MKQYLKHSVAWVLAWVLAMIAVSCQDDHDGADVYTDFRYDLVTYTGQEAEGATFEYLGQNDSTVVTLHSNLDKQDDLKVGRRLLLNYKVLERLSPSNWRVQVNNYSTGVASDSLRYNTHPLEDYAMHPIRLKSLWRTGNYINLRCELEYTGKARQLYLMIDKETHHADTVHCYLVHDLLGAPATYFWRSCYASFYVGQVWRLESCKTLRVHVNDETYPDRTYYDFSK